MKKEQVIAVKTVELKAGYVFALSRSTEGCLLLLALTEAQDDETETIPQNRSHKAH